MQRRPTTTTTLAESERRKQKDSQKKRKSPRIAVFFGKRKGIGIQEGDLHTPAPSVQLEMEPGRYQKRKRRRWRRGRRLEVKGMERRGWRRRKRRNVKPSLFFFFLLLLSCKRPTALLNAVYTHWDGGTP